MRKKIKSIAVSCIRSEQGAGVLAITVMLLVVVTLLGVMSMSTSNMDTLITGNTRRLKEFFYISEGGTKIEQVELGRGGAIYPIGELDNPNRPVVIAKDDGLNPNAVQDGTDIDETGNNVADAAFDHTTPAGDYEFMLNYFDYYDTGVKGMGKAFSRADFIIDTYSDPGQSDFRVTTRCYKIVANNKKNS